MSSNVLECLLSSGPDIADNVLEMSGMSFVRAVQKIIIDAGLRIFNLAKVSSKGEIKNERQ
jgi:hypothetical protein